MSVQQQEDKTYREILLSNANSMERYQMYQTRHQSQLIHNLTLDLSRLNAGKCPLPHSDLLRGDGL